MTNDDADLPQRNPHVESEHVDVGTAHIEVKDAQLYMTPGARHAFRNLLRAIVVLFVIIFIIGGANLLYTNSQVATATALATKVQANNTAIQQQQAQLEKQLRGDCGFYAHLSTTAVPISTANNKGSLPITQLVSDTRVAWTVHECPGQLPAPDPSFVKWAAYYHLPLS